MRKNEWIRRELLPSAVQSPRAVILASILSAMLSGPAVVMAADSPIIISDPAAPLGCRNVEGHYVVYLAPGLGPVVLSTRKIPGGSVVGALEDGQLRFQLPGRSELRTRLGVGSDTAPVWAWVDRTVELGDRRGCLGLGDRRFSSVGDLATYVRWLLRDVFFRLPSDQLESDPVLTVRGREVALVVQREGRGPVELRGPEGATLGLRTGETSSLLFQPFVLDAATPRLWVRVFALEGKYYGDGAKEEVAAFVVAADEPVRLLTPTELEVRAVAVDH